MMKSFLTTAVVAIAIAATSASAMPMDQREAAAPPQPLQGQLTLEQYEAMPLAERKAVVSILDAVAAAAAGNANSADATTVGLSSPWSWLKCKVCEKAISFFTGKIASKGCAYADPLAISACEVAGLGPEDPLADLCAAALVEGCSIVVKDIEKHITNHAEICKHIHMCK